jgi:hypothetical protein
VRSCGSRALTLLLATSAVAGCGGGDDKPTGPPTPRDLVAHSASTPATARPAILAAAERSITEDARARRRRGELDDRTRRTSCKPRQGEDATADAVVYDCLAVTFQIKATVGAPPLASGYPFQVRVEYPEHRYTWCKVRPPGGEGTGRPGREIAPPDACGGVG